MTILCIETSTNICSAAICVDGVPTDEHISHEGGNHARLLPLYIEQLLQTAAAQQRSIQAVAVSCGPGSYTGLRIGTSTAKGLAYGMQIPLIPVPTLQILCAAAMQQMGENIASADILCPMIDARRMEVYTALYDTQLNPLTETQAVVVEQEKNLSSLSGNHYYFGDGAAKCNTILGNASWHYIPDIIPQARYMGALAEKLPHADVAYYEPFYLKEFIAAQSHVKGLKS